MILLGSDVVAETKTKCDKSGLGVIQDSVVCSGVSTVVMGWRG